MSVDAFVAAIRLADATGRGHIRGQSLETAVASDNGGNLCRHVRKIFNTEEAGEDVEATE